MPGARLSGTRFRSSLVKSRSMRRTVPVRSIQTCITLFSSKQIPRPNSHCQYGGSSRRLSARTSLDSCDCRVHSIPDPIQANSTSSDRHRRGDHVPGRCLSGHSMSGLDTLGPSRARVGNCSPPKRPDGVSGRCHRGVKPVGIMGPSLCDERRIYERYAMPLARLTHSLFCAIGFAQEKTIGSSEGLNTYRSMIPFLTSIPSTLGSYSPEFRLWTERMLSRMVAVSMKSKPLGEWMDLKSMLQMFHLWLSLFRFTPTNPKLPVPYEPPRQAPSLIDLGLEVDYSRWDVWMAYYETLSEILVRGYIYAPAYSDIKPELVYSRDGLVDSECVNARLMQRTEIKKVEANIETKLLQETHFPKATERNSRVERWVDAVMQNWRIMCGPSWHDDELGEGGKNAIARGVLDVCEALTLQETDHISNMQPDSLPRSDKDLSLYPNLTIPVQCARLCRGI